jgi:NADP-dependent 3-hydroxy acid dehydrogenase YdfG
MGDFQGKVVAITGGASGLGAATARAFASRGARLALCDIDGERLRAVKSELESRGCEVITEVVDVAQAWQVEEWCENTYKAMGQVDVLVNNAGVALAGRLEDMTSDDWQWILGINLMGVIHGSRCFYPRMRQRGTGHIVNISSAAGMTPLPMLAAYCGTKSAVLAMTRVWRAEAVCPGFMTTNIAKSVRTCSGTRRRSPEAFGQLVDRFFQKGDFDPAKTAEWLVHAVEKNKGIVRGGPETKIADTLNRLSRVLVDAVVRISARVSTRWA